MSSPITALAAALSATRAQRPHHKKTRPHSFQHQYGIVDARTGQQSKSCLSTKELSSTLTKQEVSEGCTCVLNHRSHPTESGDASVISRFSQSAALHHYLGHSFLLPPVLLHSIQCRLSNLRRDGVISSRQPHRHVSLVPTDIFTIFLPYLDHNITSFPSSSPQHLDHDHPRVSRETGSADPINCHHLHTDQQRAPSKFVYTYDWWL